jgi:di/tricarboxylate transporter
MTPDIAKVLAIVVGALILFVSNRIRMDLVALLVIVSLAVTDLVSYPEALSGFSNPAVVTVWAVFILSGGLSRTGIARLLGRNVLKFAGSSEAGLIAVLMMTAGILSAFMNNVGVAALLLPVTMDVARRTGRLPSKLLMPLAFGSLLGGLTTLIGTPPNLLASDALREHGLQPFGFFDFAPVGITVLLAGTAFVVLLGRHLLPTRHVIRDSTARDLNQWETHYGLERRIFMLEIPANSPLKGKSLAESHLGSALGVTVLAVIRGDETNLAPSPSMMLRPGDRLLVQGQTSRLEDLRDWRQLEVEKDSLGIDRLLSTECNLAEIKIGPKSPLSGQTIGEADMRRRFGLNVLALRHDGRVRRKLLHGVHLQPGDCVLVQAPASALEKVRQSGDFASLEILSSQELVDSYRLHERLFAAHVPADSQLAGRTLTETRLGEAFGLLVLGIIREGATHLMPDPDESLRPADTLLIAGDIGELSILKGLQSLEIDSHKVPELSTLESEEVGLAEVVLSPFTTLAGKSPRQINFREKYGLSVLAVWREGEPLTTGLRNMPLRFGDALLLFGRRQKLILLGKDPDFLVLTEAAQEVARLEKAPLAGIIMGIVLAPVLLGWIHISIAAVAGASLMVLTRCLTMEEAYRYIEWRAVFLIAGMLPLGIAMERTGTAELFAGGVVDMVGGYGPLAVVTAFFVITSISTQAIPPAALVVLMAPIAIRTAADLGLSPHSLMITVALAAAASFMSPITHPANIMIMGPGGYRYTDYLRLGVPLTLVVLVAVVVAVPIFWPPVPPVQSQAGIDSPQEAELMEKTILVPFLKGERSLSPENLAKDLDALPAHPIDQVNWAAFPGRPEAYFRIGYNKQGIWLHYSVREGSLRALAKNPNDPVYEDSCVEFFVASHADHYVNFEFNCIGTCLVGRGASRSNRMRLTPEEIGTIVRTGTLGDQPFGLREGDFDWDLTVFIPNALLPESPASGKEWRANFYKCGDKLPQPHFLSWSRIHTPQPDFHQPAYFGRLVFE